MCTKTSQRNMQHKKSCAPQNASFMKRLQDAIKTKGMGEMTVVQRLLDGAYTNMEAFKKKK